MIDKLLEFLAENVYGGIFFAFLIISNIYTLKLYIKAQEERTKDIKEVWKSDLENRVAIKSLMDETVQAIKSNYSLIQNVLDFVRKGGK